MTVVAALTKRNIKLFFKDKGMFFTALITPAILLVLYATFLGNIYRDSFLTSMPAGFTISEAIISGIVGGQLISSILAVSCVTVAFCSNMLSVQDKVTGALRDLSITPARPHFLSISYYLATLATTLIVALSATTVCLCYLAVVGWYLSVTDVLLLIADVLLLSLFGTALSSIITHFLSSQGQISAVGTVVSAGYGFICGAYMPISQFSKGLQRIISFLPGTYGTSLIRNHALRGAFDAMREEHVPDAVIDAVRDSIDCNLYFFEKSVTLGTMYLILGFTVTILIAVYILLNLQKRRIRS